MVATVTVTVRD